MVDVAMLTKRGGRDHNEDYITKAEYEDQMCLILCDGLGGHACGEVASELVAECKTRDEAAVALRGGLDAIEDTAQAVVTSEGYEYDVSVKLCEEEYPTKNYESVCFPSGSYTSLRVQIGEAEGKNWWCVLFPQLCLGVATERNEEAFVEVGFTPEQYRIVTDTDEPEYEVRFKILEIIEGLMQ